jgi:hypothetical protein
VLLRKGKEGSLEVAARRVKSRANAAVAPFEVELVALLDRAGLQSGDGRGKTSAIAVRDTGHIQFPATRLSRMPRSDGLPHRPPRFLFDLGIRFNAGSK